MIGKMSARFAAWLLRWVSLSNEDRQILTAALLDRLGALPVRARITEDETGTIFVNGRPLTMEGAHKMRESSKAMLTNHARKLVREAVLFMAIQKGVHENVTPEQGLFAKAALWFYQEEDILFRKFAQVEVEEDDQ